MKWCYLQPSTHDAEIVDVSPAGNGASSSALVRRRLCFRAVPTWRGRVRPRTLLQVTLNSFNLSSLVGQCQTLKEPPNAIKRTTADITGGVLKNGVGTIAMSIVCCDCFLLERQLSGGICISGKLEPDHLAPDDACDRLNSGADRHKFHRGNCGSLGHVV